MSNSFLPCPTGEVAYDIDWFQSPSSAMENGAVPMISMDHWGVVKKSRGNEGTHYSIQRTDRDTYVLNLYSVQDRDMGGYYCTAKLWHFSPDTRLWKEGQRLTSASVFLSINLPCNDFSICTIYKDNCKLANYFCRHQCFVLKNYFFCLFSVGLFEEPSVIWPWSSSGCRSAVYCSWSYHFPLLLLQKPDAHTTQQAHGPGNGLSHVTQTLPPANVTSFYFNPLQDSMAANVLRNCIEPQVFMCV